MMEDTIKALIDDARECVQKENVERQQNVILETMGNHNDSRNIGEAILQALEWEEKIKAATSGIVIDAKVSSSVRKFYCEETLQMIKLVKKVVELEK